MMVDGLKNGVAQTTLSSLLRGRRTMEGKALDFHARGRGWDSCSGQAA